METTLIDKCETFLSERENGSVDDAQALADFVDGLLLDECEHSYAPLNGKVYYKRKYGSTVEQSKGYLMLFCGACGNTREVVAEINGDD